MRAAFVALAAGLCASAAPAFEPRAGLETRAPHGDYTCTLRLGLVLARACLRSARARMYSEMIAHAYQTTTP